MPVEKTFKINDYLTLKLVGEETVIYIVRELFLLCKALLLNIPVYETEGFRELESIDDIADILRSFPENDYEDFNRFLVYKGSGFRISPETEFFVHCSNLQAWYEHEYDTNLLHSSIAFPLLKALTDVGDKKAKHCFKSEIVRRFENGNWSVMNFLNSYLKYLNEEERSTCIINAYKKSLESGSDGIELLIDSEYDKHIDREEFFRAFLKKSDVKFVLELYQLVNGHFEIDNMFIRDKIICHFWRFENDEFSYFLIIDDKSVEFLSVSVTRKTKSIIKPLKSSNISKSIFPDSIKNLKSLETLVLEDIPLLALPESILKLKSLRELTLSSNQLAVLPESLGNLKSLQILDLSSNKLITLPNSIGSLYSLKELYAGDNQLTILPESIGKLKSLQILDLNNNKLLALPNSIGNLSSLKELKVLFKQLTALPESIKKIKSLECLHLAVNSLDKKTNIILKQLEKRRIKIYLYETKWKEQPRSWEDSEEIGDATECPFCGEKFEIFDNLVTHIKECPFGPFAPDDANISDILPSKI